MALRIFVERLLDNELLVSNQPLKIIAGLLAFAVLGALMFFFINRQNVSEVATDHSAPSSQENGIDDVSLKDRFHEDHTGTDRTANTGDVEREEIEALFSITDQGSAEYLDAREKAINRFATQTSRRYQILNANWAAIRSWQSSHTTGKASDQRFQFPLFDREVCQIQYTSFNRDPSKPGLMFSSHCRDIGTFLGRTNLDDGKFGGVITSDSRATRYAFVEIDSNHFALYEFDYEPSEPGEDY